MTLFLDDANKYKQMLRQGAEPTAIYLAAKEDGVNRIACIRLLRELFEMTLAQAKETIIVADGVAPSLTAHQANLLPALRMVLINSGSDSDSEEHSKQDQASTISGIYHIRKVSGL